MMSNQLTSHSAKSEGTTKLVPGPMEDSVLSMGKHATGAVPVTETQPSQRLRHSANIPLPPTPLLDKTEVSVSKQEPQRLVTSTPTEEPAASSPSKLSSQPQPPELLSGPQTPPRHDREVTNHDRLLRLAGRAREIHLASKVFNHWADRTARRLERDAVARRHMIRFRCFRSWSQVPESREMAVDQMRATTAFKKWQRFVREGHVLSATVTSAQRCHRARLVQDAVDKWSCSRLRDAACIVMAARTRTESTLKWVEQASANAALDEAIRIQTRARSAKHAWNLWAALAEKNALQSSSAARLATTQQSFNSLREWWDQTEISRRATMFRHRLLLDKAVFAFDQWSLQARTQAFIWRQECLAVTNTVTKWLQLSRNDSSKRHNATEYSQNRLKQLGWSHLHRLSQDRLQLHVLERRARLYLRSAEFMRVLDRAVKQRKMKGKEMVRQQLMAKYAQMSSARKKRAAFRAIDQWKTMTMQNKSRQLRVADLQKRNLSTRVAVAVDTWLELAEEEMKAMRTAQTYATRDWLDTWADRVSQLRDREDDAWQLWASAQQRYFLKTWSIASLQRSGQAHTASEVCKKHDREKRQRALQIWRERGLVRDRAGLGPVGHRDEAHPFSSSIHPPRSHGVSRRSVPLWLHEAKTGGRPQDYPGLALETPTRWTGQPLPMSAVLRGGEMAPVREAEEETANSSVAGDEDVVALSPIRNRFLNLRAGRSNAATSTTPRGPVPPHIGRDFGTPDPPEAGQIDKGLGFKSTLRLPPSSGSRGTSGLAAEGSEQLRPKQPLLRHVEKIKFPAYLPASRKMPGAGEQGRPSPLPTLSAGSKSVGTGLPRSKVLTGRSRLAGSTTSARIQS